MQLDFTQKGNFLLWVARGEIAPDVLMYEHGFDYSEPASNPNNACFYTDEPYAAVAFWQWASPAARARLAILKREIDASWALAPAGSAWPDYLCPADKTPYPLQLADLEYVLRRKNCLVADEPGVGKTPTANMVANMLAARRRSFRALAIVPASIRLQWHARIREWSTIPNVSVSVLSTASRGIPSTADHDVQWTILSYDQAWRPGIEHALMANHYDLLVLDEAHYLKSPTARRSRAILGAADRTASIGDRADHILALTGTPIPNRPREAYGLAKALCFDAVDWMSERGFNERFNPQRKKAVKSGRVVVEERQGRYPELQARLRATFMVRHLKRDAMPQLRLPVFDLVYADETAPVRAALQAERLLDIDPETFTGADGKIDGAVSTARKLMGIALAPQAVRYAETLLEGGEDTLVVFAWHIEAMDIIQKGLDKYGVVRVDGRSSERDKARAVVAFQTDPDIRVILGNVLSLGTGTDGLQAVCGHCLVAEPDWVMGNNVQMVDRLDRGGQTRTVLADFFVARGSISERVLAAALRKGAVVHKALDARVVLGI